MKRRVILYFLVFVATLLLFVLAEFLIIKYNGSPVAVPDIPRSAQTLGKGAKVRYVIMGDSTSVGQGTDYKNSYAVASAKHLAEKYTVDWINFGVSGARTKDILTHQLGQAAAYKPDLVLLAVGANDANHATDGKSLQTDLQAIIDGLKKSNPHIRIVFTGSPALDSVPRYIWPYKQYRGIRTQQVNEAFKPIVEKNQLTFAPIASKTREAFLADPTLFAVDKFHPNARGYKLWTAVILDALDETLAKSPP